MTGDKGRDSIYNAGMKTQSYKDLVVWQKDRSRKNRLSIDAEVAIGREVWLGRANAAVSSVNTVEHSGGSGAPYYW